LEYESPDLATTNVQELRSAPWKISGFVGFRKRLMLCFVPAHDFFSFDLVGLDRWIIGRSYA
jgi:hypothetical protein